MRIFWLPRGVAAAQQGVADRQRKKSASVRLTPRIYGDDRPTGARLVDLMTTRGVIRQPCRWRRGGNRACAIAEGFHPPARPGRGHAAREDQSRLRDGRSGRSGTPPRRRASGGDAVHRARSQARRKCARRRSRGRPPVRRRRWLAQRHAQAVQRLPADAQFLGGEGRIAQIRSAISRVRLNTSLGALA